MSDEPMGKIEVIDERMRVPDSVKHLSRDGWCHTCDKAVAGCEEGMAVAHAQRYVGGYPFTSTFARWEIAELLALLFHAGSLIPGNTSSTAQIVQQENPTP